ncbi:MAG TPA: carboxypeptidase regulatory-like domain-containing protein [Bacteroidia bacterium]
MNLKQSAQLLVFNAIVAVLNSFSSVWSANTVVSTAITNFTAYLNTLLLAEGVKLTGTKPTTATKNLGRSTLVTFALNHARAGLAYAASNNLPALKQICSATPSTFIRLKEVDVEPFCRNIYNAVQPYIGSMTLYGATTTSMATFNTSLNNYHSLVGTPMAQRSATRMASLTIAQQMTNIKNLLHNSIDPLLTQYSSNVNFMNQYDSARHANSTHNRHTVIIKGLVTDVHTNLLPDAVLRIIELPRRHKHITDTTGKYEFTRLHINTTYTVEVSLSGYVTQTFVVNENAAKTIEHTFVMVIPITPPTPATA